MDFEVRLTLSVDEQTGEITWLIWGYPVEGQGEILDFGEVGPFMTRRELAERLVRQVTVHLPRTGALRS